MDKIHDIIRSAETNYVNGTVKISDYVDFSMHKTIQRIDAYLNSMHTSGSTDSLGREKPFFNIVTAASNIWYRATDIDRKDIKFIPKTQKSIPLALIANVLLQKWMDDNRFGKWLNDWGRIMSRYGSAVPKFVEKGKELIPSVIAWNRLIVDPVDFEALPRIEKFYLTPAQLRKNKDYDKKAVDNLISTIQSRKTLSGINQDNQNGFIELYEVHGELDSRLLQKDPDLNIEDKDIVYVQQMHVVSYVKNDKNGYDDFTLYKGREAKDPYKITHLIEEDGRTISIGSVESLFDAQWMQNHSVKNMKDTLDLASKLIFQTADANFVGRNVLSAIESGDILVHSANSPLTRVANDKPDITAMQNFGQMWRNLGQEITSTPDALRGNTLPSGTPFALGQMLAQQSNSLFEIMVENKGLYLEDILLEYVIPHLKKQLKNKDEVLAILDDAGITEIDALYIPNEAIRRYNKSSAEQVIAGQNPEPFNPAMAQGTIKQKLGSLGNKRSFKPSEMDDKTWAEVFSDFEWDSIRVEITNENVDKQAAMQTLSTVLQTIASNPMVLQDPNAKLIFNEILKQTSIISPLQLSSTQSVPNPTPTQTPSAAPPALGGGITPGGIM